MGAFLEGVFALIGLAVVLSYAAGYWLAQHTPADPGLDAARRIRDVANSAEQAMHDVAGSDQTSAGKRKA